MRVEICLLGEVVDVNDVGCVIGKEIFEGGVEEVIDCCGICWVRTRSNGRMIGVIEVGGGMEVWKVVLYGMTDS